MLPLTEAGDGKEKKHKIKDFSEGLSPFANASKQTGYFNTEGKVVIEPQFHSVGYFSAGLAWAKTSEGKVGFINKKGEWVIKAEFDAAKEFELA